METQTSDQLAQSAEDSEMEDAERNGLKVIELAEELMKCEEECEKLKKLLEEGVDEIEVLEAERRLDDALEKYDRLRSDWK